MTTDFYRAIVVAAGLACGLAQAADDAALSAAERARIADARSATATRFRDAEMACWRRFAVNACIDAARTERRLALRALRDQELALNEKVRQARTAERLQRLRDKQEPEGNGAR